MTDNISDIHSLSTAAPQLHVYQNLANCVAIFAD